jgi:hypothetical protein
MNRNSVNASEKRRTALRNQAQPKSITKGLKILVSAVQFRLLPPVFQSVVQFFIHTSLLDFCGEILSDSFHETSL